MGDTSEKKASLVESAIVAPKVFISYSWTSESHREMVRGWADRLLADGVQIVLDQYDLKEGDDKNSFMERMVTDLSVTHVLVVSDRMYAEKADARKAGVGTESQIISQEVYNRVKQSKFIPILCEFTEVGDPYLPTFMKSRIGINFSSPERENENWEQLVRLLFGKPAYKKPEVGKPPLYISEDKTSPSNPAISKFASFKQAFQQGKKGLSTYRNDFLASWFQYADALRVRKTPTEQNFAARVVADCGKLVQIRDLLADWVLLEANATDTEQFVDTLSTTLEKLLELSSRPNEVTSWQDWWFEAHSLFVYESFLYILAALLKAGAFATLHDVFMTNYLSPEVDRNTGSAPFVSFEAFWTSSGLVNRVLAPEGKRLLSPTGTLLHNQASREDLPFESIMEADLLALLASVLNGRSRWFPQTIVYAGYGKVFPFFLRATQHKHFKKLSIITGVPSGEELRTRAMPELKELTKQSGDFRFHSHVSFSEALNMDKLDTVS